MKLFIHLSFELKISIFDNANIDSFIPANFLCNLNVVELIVVLRYTFVLYVYRMFCFENNVVNLEKKKRFIRLF